MNGRRSLKFVKSSHAPQPCQTGSGERGGTCLAPSTYDFTISFVRTHQTISMKEGLVTGEGERYGDEKHAIDKAFRDHESAGTAGADRSLRASGVCRNIRGWAVRGNPSTEPEQRNSHARWIWWTRYLRPIPKKFRDGGCKARSLLHKSPLDWHRD